MRLSAIEKWLSLGAALMLAGCNQNPYLSPPQATWQQQQLQPQQGQVHDLTRQATALDANNRDLHAQLAQSSQQVKLLREQVTLLQKQLADTTQQLQTAQVAKTQAEKNYETLQAKTARRSGAIITANNSRTEALRAVSIPGVEIREDGDRIRLELPTDQLFAPGTAQLVGSAFPLLDRVAAEIAQNYPQQKITIEGHVDNAPIYGGISGHQLTSAQALAIFDQFTRRNRLPAYQFSVSAHGDNHPLASNGTQAGRTKNRRIELVIDPEYATAR